MKFMRELRKFTRKLVFNNSRMDELPTEWTMHQGFLRVGSPPPLTEWTFDKYLFSNMKPSTAKHPNNKAENNGYNAENS